MRAGELREVITIKAPPVGQNAYGEVDPNAAWTDVLTTRASLQPLIGREYYLAEEVRSQVEVKFTLRYKSSIQAKHRVLHRGILYEIMAVVNVSGAYTELLLYCRRKYD